jgi:YD repeat-containing protein
MPFQISILAFFVFYNDASIFQTSYERDSLGRITILTEVSQGNTVVKQYSYDITGRLWKVLKNDTLISTYTYDANGNRIARSTPTTVDSGSYDAQDRMLKYGNAQYIYTKNGELLKKVIGNDTTSYAYDYLGNLVTVLLPSGDQIDYIIDGQNRRVGKKLNGNLVKRWVYSSGLLPIAELDSAGNVMAQFVGNMMYKNGNTYQLITDHLGSVRLVVDKNTGDIAQQMEYDEFGNVLSDLNPEFQPLGYAGGMYDNQTKLVRFGARDYDVWEDGRAKIRLGLEEAKQVCMVMLETIR